MTQRKYWIVKMRDGKEFQLTQEEYQLLKQTSLAGLSTVFYERFSINLPDMAYSEERTENIMPVQEMPELTEEEQRLADAKLQEIRKKLGKKLSIN